MSSFTPVFLKVVLMTKFQHARCEAGEDAADITSCWNWLKRMIIAVVFPSSFWRCRIKKSFLGMEGKILTSKEPRSFMLLTK